MINTILEETTNSMINLYFFPTYPTSSMIKESVQEMDELFYLHTDFAETLILYVKRISKNIFLLAFFLNF